MPGVVGSVNVINLFAGAAVGFGDAAAITPKSTTKTEGGAGSFNTGRVIRVSDPFSITMIFDTAAASQPIFGNK